VLFVVVVVEVKVDLQRLNLNYLKHFEN